MTLAIILVVAAILSLVLIVVIASSRTWQLAGGSNLVRQIDPIDVEAFRNLINAADDAFLRESLAPKQFRVVRRARLRATAAYVSQAGRNAAVLVHIGQAAMVSSDLRTQQAAQELVNDALLVRRNAAFALLKIYAAQAWPNSALPAAGIAERYEHLSGSAMLLGRLQNPAASVRLAARLQ
jgi:hypothetical protein